MKESLKIIAAILGSIIGLFLVIAFGLWIFSDPFDWITDDAPVLQSSYQVCLQKNVDKILEQYNQCVKDSQGNNVRCRDSVRTLICGGY